VSLPAFIAIGHAERAERDALIELHVVADEARLADDDAGAMVDEEALADARARVDVDAGARVRLLGDDRGIIGTPARKSRWATRYAMIASSDGYEKTISSTFFAAGSPS